MTLAQAANIHAKWKQHGEPLCVHPIQELVRLARSDDGVLMGTYHCHECGEAAHQICNPYSTRLIDPPLAHPQEAATQGPS